MFDPKKHDHAVFSPYPSNISGMIGEIVEHSSSESDSESELESDTDAPTNGIKTINLSSSNDILPLEYDMSKHSLNTASQKTFHYIDDSHSIPLSEPREDDQDGEIWTENKQKLSKMTKSEILSSKNEILSALDPELIAKMKSRAIKKRQNYSKKPKHTSQQNEIASLSKSQSFSDRDHYLSATTAWFDPDSHNDTKQKSTPSTQLAKGKGKANSKNDIYSNTSPHERSLVSSFLESSEMSIQSKSRKDLPGTSASPHWDPVGKAIDLWRFDLTGNILKASMKPIPIPSQSLNTPHTQPNPTIPDMDDTNRSLFHHGKEPSIPGYTLQEYLLFARSSVTSQRILALKTIRSIFLKTNYSHRLLHSELYKTVESDVVDVPDDASNSSWIGIYPFHVGLRLLDLSFCSILISILGDLSQHTSPNTTLRHVTIECLDALLKMPIPFPIHDIRTYQNLKEFSVKVPHELEPPILFPYIPWLPSPYNNPTNLDIDPLSYQPFVPTIYKLCHLRQSYIPNSLITQYLSSSNPYLDLIFTQNPAIAFVISTANRVLSSGIDPSVSDSSQEYEFELKTLGIPENDQFVIFDLKEALLSRYGILSLLNSVFDKDMIPLYCSILITLSAHSPEIAQIVDSSDIVTSIFNWLSTKFLETSHPIASGIAALKLLVVLISTSGSIARNRAFLVKKMFSVLLWYSTMCSDEINTAISLVFTCWKISISYSIHLDITPFSSLLVTSLSSHPYLYSMLTHLAIHSSSHTTIPWSIPSSFLLSANSLAKTFINNINLGSDASQSFDSSKSVNVSVLYPQLTSVLWYLTTIHRYGNKLPTTTPHTLRDPDNYQNFIIATKEKMLSEWIVLLEPIITQLIKYPSFYAFDLLHASLSLLNVLGCDFKVKTTFPTDASSTGLIVNIVKLLEKLENWVLDDTLVRNWDIQNHYYSPLSLRLSAIPLISSIFEFHPNPNLNISALMPGQEKLALSILDHGHESKPKRYPVLPNLVNSLKQVVDTTLTKRHSLWISPIHSPIPPILTLYGSYTQLPPFLQHSQEDYVPFFNEHYALQSNGQIHLDVPYHSFYPSYLLPLPQDSYSIPIRMAFLNSFALTTDPNKTKSFISDCVEILTYLTTSSTKAPLLTSVQKWILAAQIYATNHIVFFDPIIKPILSKFVLDIVDMNTSVESIDFTPYSPDTTLQFIVEILTKFVDNSFGSLEYSWLIWILILCSNQWISKVTIQKITPWYKVLASPSRFSSMQINVSVKSRMSEIWEEMEKRALENIGNS